MIIDLSAICFIDLSNTNITLHSAGQGSGIQTDNIHTAAESDAQQITAVVSTKQRLFWVSVQYVHDIYMVPRLKQRHSHCTRSRATSEVHSLLCSLCTDETGGKPQNCTIDRK